MTSKTTLAAIAAYISIVTSAQSQILGPAHPLPGDSQPSLVAGRQERPAIARGNTGYLVVWMDNRSSLFDHGTNGAGVNGPYFGPQLGSMVDLYAARLDANGELVDTSPILISQAQYNQTWPKVAWNGEHWLVVWMTERQSDRYRLDIMAARVSPGGVVLDTPPILIDAGFTDDPHNPWSVSSDGTNWSIVWRDSDAALGAFTIDGARVSPAGAVLDPGGKRLYGPATNTGVTDADLAWAGDEYLLTFLELDSTGWCVRGQRLTAALEPLGNKFTISLYSPSAPRKPVVASNGTAFLVAWFENRYEGSTQVFGARVAHDGTVLDPGGLELTDRAGYTQFEPDVAWDGSVYVVAHNARDDIYTTRVTDSGTVVAPGSVAVKAGPGTQIQPAIAPRFSGGAMVAWNNDVDRGDILSAAVSSTGDPSHEVAVSLGAPRQSHPRMATSGAGFLVVFRSQIASEARIMAQRLDASGVPLDAEPHVVGAGSDLRNPAVAWNGIDYLIVWENALEGRGQVYGRRMNADGILVDAAPVSLLAGNMPDVAALGSTFLVVVSYEWFIKKRYAYAVRVGADGAPIGTPVRIGAHYDEWPRVIAAGQRWLAVWQQRVSHDNPRSQISGAFISAEGTPSERFDVSDHNYRATPHLAHGENTTLVAWSDRDIFGRRIQDDGTLLDSAAGIVISNAPLDQFTPAVTWDGAQWIVEYLDHRNEGYPKQPRGDIYATRVDASGTVIDPNGFAVAKTPLPEETPAIIASDGVVIYGYTAFHDQAPYKNLRITIRTNVALGCESIVAPTNVTAGAAAGSGSVALNTADPCNWVARSDVSWLTPAPENGTGSATITYSFSANEGVSRTGTITIGDAMVTVTQEDGCIYSVSSASLEIPAGGLSASISLTTGAECPWSASSIDDWITITSAADGQGSAKIELTVAANHGVARNGTITVGGKNVAIQQLGAALPPPPPSLTAAATSATEVRVSWSAVDDAIAYEIARSSNGSPFTVIASRSTPSLEDSGLTPGTSYVYKVRTVTEAGSSTFSGADAGTTIVFDDDTLLGRITPVRAVHVQQLRDAVNALRRSAALPAATFSDASLAGIAIRTAHIQELRDAVAEARNAVGLPPISFGTAEPRNALIRAADLEELRSGVR
jgi:hypothetical protein